MSAERWGALPLGELHPENACAFCGAKEGELPWHGLKLTKLVVTRAWAHVCVDVIACERRRYNQRRKV